VRQVDAENGMQGSPGIKCWSIRLLGGVPGRRQLADRLGSQGPKSRQDRLDALITGRNLLLVSIVQFHGLGQSEDVLLPVIADQGLPDGVHRGMTARVTMSCQHRRIPLTGDEGADDGHAGHPGDIRDNVMELKIHLHQRLLPVLDMRGGRVKQPFALPQVGTQRGDLALRPEAAAQ
jgi:hypothetical protein